MATTELNHARQIRSPILRNALANWIGLIFQMAVAFYLSPFLINCLGKTKYGTWVVLGQIIAYTGIMDLGIRNSVTVFTSRFIATRNYAELHALLATSLKLYLPISASIALLALLLHTHLTAFFNLPSELLSETKHTFLLLALTFSTQIIMNTFSAVLSGAQRYDISNAIAIVILLLRTCTILFVLPKTHSLLVLATITFAFEQLRHCLVLYYTIRVLPHFRLSRALLAKSHFPFTTIFSFSTYSVLMHSATLIIFYTDTVVIGHFLTTTLVTYYSVSWTLVDYIRRVILRMAYVLAPAAGDLSQRVSKRSLHELANRTSSAALAIYIPSCVFLIFFGKELLGLWVGNDFPSKSYPVLVVLLLAEAMNSALAPCSSILLGLGKHRRIAIARVAEALLNLGISLTFVRPYGILGVAVGTLLPSIFINLFIMYPYAVSILSQGNSSKDLLGLKQAAPPLVICVCAATLLSILPLPTSWSSFVLRIVLFSASYLISIWLFFLTHSQKRTVIAVLISALKKSGLS